MADYRVLCADFRETLTAAEGRAVLVATSPPYPSSARTCYGSLAWEDYQALGDAVLDALAPGGHCLLNLSAPIRQLREGHGTERDPMPFRVFLDWYDRVGLTAPDVLAFGRKGLPGGYIGRFRSDWEPMFWFRKPGQPVLFKERLKTPSIRWDPGGRPTRHTTRDGGTFERLSNACGDTHRGTVWQYGAIGCGQTGDMDLEAQGHPARWPYRLAADIVACFSDVGDLVVDPFVGGGTTLCAACDGDREFLGGDNSEEWAAKSLELADRRYAQMTLGAARG